MVGVFTRLLTPAAVGANDAWLLGAGASKPVAVSSNDANTSYIRSNSNVGDEQSFTLDQTQLRTGDQINWVRTLVVARRESISAGGDLDVLLDYAATQIVYPVTLGQSYPSSPVASAQLATNPATGLPWTIAEVNALVLSVRTAGNFQVYRRLTYLALEVEVLVNATVGTKFNVKASRCFVVGTQFLVTAGAANVKNPYGAFAIQLPSKLKNPYGAFTIQLPGRTRSPYGAFTIQLPGRTTPIFGAFAVQRTTTTPASYGAFRIVSQATPGTYGAFMVQRTKVLTRTFGAFSIAKPTDDGNQPQTKFNVKGVAEQAAEAKFTVALLFLRQVFGAFAVQQLDRSRDLYGAFSIAKPTDDGNQPETKFNVKGTTSVANYGAFLVVSPSTNPVSYGAFAIQKKALLRRVFGAFRIVRQQDDGNQPQTKFNVKALDRETAAESKFAVKITPSTPVFGAFAVLKLSQIVRVYGAFTIQIPAQTTPIFGAFTIQLPARTAPIFGAFTIGSQPTVAAYGAFLIQQVGSGAQVFGAFRIVKVNSKTLPTTFGVRAAHTRDLYGAFTIQLPARTAPVFGAFAVKGSLDRAVQTAFSVQAAGTPIVAVSGAFAVQRLGLTRSPYGAFTIQLPARTAPIFGAFAVLKLSQIVRVYGAFTIALTVSSDSAVNVRFTVAALRNLPVATKFVVVDTLHKERAVLTTFFVAVDTGIVPSPIAPADYIEPEPGE